MMVCDPLSVHQHDKAAEVSNCFACSGVPCVQGQEAEAARFKKGNSGAGAEHKDEEAPAAKQSAQSTEAATAGLSAQEWIASWRARLAEAEPGSGGASGGAVELGAAEVADAAHDAVAEAARAAEGAKEDAKAWIAAWRKKASAQAGKQASTSKAGGGSGSAKMNGASPDDAAQGSSGQHSAKEWIANWRAR